MDNVISWTGLKTKYAIRKVDYRSEWKTTINSATCSRIENDWRQDTQSVIGVQTVHTLTI